MSYSWVGERVAKVDLERVVLNVLEGRDDVSWGPNNTFRYPLQGGTGEIWNRLGCRFSTHLRFGKTLSRVDTEKRQLFFSDGTADGYDLLISTIPVDVLMRCCGLESLYGAADRLRYSTVHVAGVGLRGSPAPPLKTKCWMYFPENTSPFYRATVFSNYSPHNVPDSREYWSLLLEVSESPAKPVGRECLLESVVDGLIATRLIESKSDIVDTWQYRAGHGYPTPSLERDEALGAILPELERLGIFSRGRFGAWKYEVSNQDHSLMQGVELIDRLACGGTEETLNRPAFVNSRPK
jgi:protoporphyrinogen oxidase